MSKIATAIKELIKENKQPLKEIPFKLGENSLQILAFGKTLLSVIENNLVNNPIINPRMFVSTDVLAFLNATPDTKLLLNNVYSATHSLNQIASNELIFGASALTTLGVLLYKLYGEYKDQRTKQGSIIDNMEMPVLKFVLGKVFTKLVTPLVFYAGAKLIPLDRI